MAALTLPADATAAIVASSCWWGGLGVRVVSSEWEKRLELPVVEVLGGKFGRKSQDARLIISRANLDATGTKNLDATGTKNLDATGEKYNRVVKQS